MVCNWETGGLFAYVKNWANSIASSISLRIVRLSCSILVLSWTFYVSKSIVIILCFVFKNETKAGSKTIVFKSFPDLLLNKEC